MHGKCDLVDGLLLLVSRAIACCTAGHDCNARKCCRWAWTLQFKLHIGCWIMIDNRAGLPQDRIMPERNIAEWLVATPSTAPICLCNIDKRVSHFPSEEVST